MLNMPPQGAFLLSVVSLSLSLLMFWCFSCSNCFLFFFLLLSHFWRFNGIYFKFNDCFTSVQVIVSPSGSSVTSLKTSQLKRLLTLRVPSSCHLVIIRSTESRLERCSHTRERTISASLLQVQPYCCSARAKPDLYAHQHPNILCPVIMRHGDVWPAIALLCR